MKKVISFSIWGKDYRYTGGTLQNADLAKIIYPDWICRFYVGDDTPESLISQLSSRDNVEIIKVEYPCDWTGMFWRFLAAADTEVSVMISRDVDSRLTYREKYAVDEWINSDFGFHIIRDHEYHGVPILGGMWGAKSGVLAGIDGFIEQYNKGNFVGVDQNFLAEHVYPLISNNSLVHDEFFEKKPFPSQSGVRNSDHFVGQAYQGDGSILNVKEYGIVHIQDYLKPWGIELATYDDPSQVKSFE
jgi:hypothetical protein